MIIAFLSAFPLLAVAATPLEYGAACDCVTDDGPAIQAAIDLTTDPVLDFRGHRCCYSAQTLKLDRPGFKIIGDGPYEYSFGKIAGTYIRFAAQTAGLDIGAGAAGSIIESISLVGTRSFVDPPCTEESTGIFGVTAYGVRMHARATLRSMSIISFDGDGLIADCGAPDHLGRVGNCNSARIDDLLTQENGGWGTWKSGGDANSWLVTRITSNSDRCGCVYTREFLGSDWSHMFCQRADGSGTSGITMRNPNARNVIGWTYIENPALIDLQSPSTRLGGFGAQVSGAFLEGSLHKGIWGFQNALPRDEPAKHSQLDLTEGCGPKCAFSFEQRQTRSQPLRLTHDGTWYWFGVGPSVKAFGVGDISTPENWGVVSFARPIAFGVPPNDRTVFWSDGIPRGACRGGDVRFNSAIGPRDRCSFFVCDSGAWACGSRLP